jgi:hypothetical protein
MTGVITYEKILAAVFDLLRRSLKINTSKQGKKSATEKKALI